MDAVDQFISEFKTPLTRLSRAVVEGAPAQQMEDFVEAVLDAWTTRFESPPAAAVSDLERTFWFVLYSLEDLADVPLRDPYRKRLLHNLNMACTCLSQGAKLPSGYFATRPGELLHEEEEQEVW